MQTKRILVPLIAIILLTTLFAGIVSVSATAQTSATPLTAKSSVATANAQASGMKHVIFRDDDIDIYESVDTLQAVNQVHINKNVPVTLAIIPHIDTDSTGNELLWDKPMNNYLQTIKTNSLFEFAQHGYNHRIGGVGSSLVGGGLVTRSSAGEPSVVWRPNEKLVGDTNPGEFAGRSYADQYAAIKQGWDDINEAFSVTPTTFVPPWNVGDENTLTAAHAVGHTLYSTGWGDLSGVYVSGITVQECSLTFPWDYTSNWDTEMTSLISQTDAALNAATAGDDIVVYYHFYSFENSQGSVDPAAIAWLEQYIDHLKDRGDVDFTTLDNLYARPVSAETRITLTASNTTPAIGQSVTFNGTLSRWDPSQGKWVALTTSKLIQIWHATPDRLDDATVNTDAKGNFTYTTSWTTAAGPRPYSATFTGDKSYIQSLSDPVTINVVDREYTTLSLTPNPSSPTAGQTTTFSGTLQTTQNPAPLSNANVDLHVSTDNTNWSLVSGTSTNTTAATGAYTFSQSLSPGTYYFRTYYDGTSQYREAFSPTVKVVV